ncbi:MAG TPA: TonB-dependent receptor [Thermodesulfobacteriota bacterium]|nr:TonB-dependent receptor [Thermodesulfobacteriota bacterium]
MQRIFLALFIFFYSNIPHLSSQEMDEEDELILLEPVEVTAPRVEKLLNKVPFSVGVLEEEDIQLGRPMIGLDESLNEIPGVYAQNRYNFAQDTRISIRGFGARAAFGVRGIKILVDGIPLTLPDGQSQIDSVDLGSTERIEVIRGPVSALYGNASGGVISIITEDGPEEPFIGARMVLGSFGLQKYQAKAGGQVKNLNYLLNLSRLDLDGFREQSETENVLFNSKLRYTINENSDLTILLNYLDAPVAEDPGALTKEELEQDREQAAPANLLRDAGESVKEGRSGIVYRNYLSQNQEVNLSVYGSVRDFSQRLPFGIVSFDRLVLGGGAKYVWDSSLWSRANRLIAGVDVEYQNDDRKNFDYADGKERGELTLDQKEEVANIGVFVQNEFQILDNLELTLGLRYDYIRFSVDDSFTIEDDPDDSGSITFKELSPKVGLLYSPLSFLNIYGNFSTSFETPTTTELANSPSEAGGFNPDLKPQKAISYEAGLKGLIWNRLTYDLAVFYADVKDELIPFQVPDVPGREFFRNAGKSRHYGLELGLSLEVIDGLKLTVAYTYLNFKFKDFETEEGNFDGNRVPGIPPNQLYAEVFYNSPYGFYGGAELFYVDGYFVNDSNTEKNGSYVVTSIRLGYQKRLFRHWEVSPFLGFNNIFDEKYNSSVRVNAVAGRFFEPAPGFNVYGGASLSYVF